MRFRDRSDAGRHLARRLEHLREARPVVVGLPRGGVPVAAEIAAALEAPLDIVLVRKIGAPDREELAVGAVGEDDVTVRNDVLLSELGLSWADLRTQITHERAEIRRRATSLRPGGERIGLRDRTVIIVDDGIATGATVIAAIRVVRRLGAARIVLAVPVAPGDTLERLAEIADEVVCGYAPSRFLAVGQWYDDFAQVSDKRVRALLLRSEVDTTAPVTVASADRILTGTLCLPGGASAVVIVVGPGIPRLTDAFGAAGVATVSVDVRDDADLLAVTRNVRDEPRLADLPIGYFAAGAGVEAALRAAPDANVSAIVSCGGRPDLAGERLSGVDAPTLVIVGGRDGRSVLAGTRARERMRCRGDLAVVPGAGPGFTDPDETSTVADLATDWFRRHLLRARTA